jgi:hypothetical protein
MNMKTSRMLKIPGLAQNGGAPLARVFAVACACALLSAQAQNAPFITQPGQIAALRSPPSIRYVLEDSQIGFTAVTDSRGKALGCLATEIGLSAKPGKLAEFAQYFRTPADLAFALSRTVGGSIKAPGTSLEGGGPTDCDASWPGFHDEVLSFGYGLSFLSQSDGPSAGTGHWWASGGFSAGFYELHGQAHDVSAFFLKIQFCYEDPVAPPFQGSDGSVVDPEVFLYYRVGNAPWTLVNSGYFLEDGEQMSFWWHPFSEPLPGVAASQLDFRVVLYDAAPDDRFHIGAAWSKPFDTITN